MDYTNITYTEIQNMFDKHIKPSTQDRIQFLALKYFLEKCQKAKDVLLVDYNIVCDQEKAFKCDAMYLYRDIIKYNKKPKVIYCGLDENNHVVLRAVRN